MKPDTNKKYFKLLKCSPPAGSCLAWAQQLTAVRRGRRPSTAVLMIDKKLTTSTSWETPGHGRRAQQRQRKHI